MKNPQLERFQLALSALVGLLKSNEYTRIDTVQFREKYKMADVFFDALVQLGCLSCVERNQFQSNKLLLTIHPDEVITKVRQLSKMIVWHSAEEEQKPKAETLDTAAGTKTPLLDKALSQVETLPDSVLPPPSMDKPSEADELAALFFPEPTAEPVPASLNEKVAPPTTTPTVSDLSSEAKETAAKCVQDIILGFHDNPQMQLGIVQTMLQQLRQQQRQRADELRAEADALNQKAVRYTTIATAYDQCLVSL